MVPEEREEELKTMGFLDHLEELRSALIWSIVVWLAASIIIWFFSRNVLDFLLKTIPVESLYFHAPTEAFMIRLKISFILGFLVSFPHILFRVWAFVAPGLYRHERVMRETAKGKQCVRELFLAYLGDPHQLPPEHQERASEISAHRAICDYVAGMTDRYAEDQHLQMFGAGDGR